MATALPLLGLPLLAAAGWGLGQTWTPEATITAAPPPAAASPPTTALGLPPLPLTQASAADAIALDPEPGNGTETSALEPLPWPLEGALALGGPITRASRQEPVMLPMARAELLLQQRSNDPLAALPAALRQPLRLQLKHQREGIERARVVVLPLRDLREPVAVPLVRSANGDVDVYADSMEPHLNQALEQWLVNLDPLPPGQVQPLLLKLKPWPVDRPEP